MFHVSARGGRPATPTERRRPPSLARASGLLCAACLLALAVPAPGAPIYRISFERSGYGIQYGVTQGTPFQHADSYGVPGSSAVFTGSAFSYPGHVGIDNRVEMYWPAGTQSSRYDVYSSASTGDFVITGPAAPLVSGQLHLRVRANLARSGGVAGNSAHGARLNVDARARSGQFVVLGDLYSTNYDTHGTGVLAGLSSPAVDVPFVLSGSFPVGTPFDVYIRVFGIETVYGNSGSDPNPGDAHTDAGSHPGFGLFLEEVDGQVMTLPGGYTLDSPAWGVTDNHFRSGVGVAPALEGGPIRLAAHPNPVTADATIVFDQPLRARVRLQVFDVGGRLVRTLADEWRAEGPQDFRWDGRGDDGRPAGAGMYFLRLRVGDESAALRIVLLGGGSR